MSDFELALQTAVDINLKLIEMHRDFENNHKHSKYTFDEINQMHRNYGWAKTQLIPFVGDQYAAEEMIQVETQHQLLKSKKHFN